MTAIFDAFMEFWDWLMRVLGFRRAAPSGSPEELERRGVVARALGWVKPAIVVLLLAYFAALVWRFGWIRGEDMSYPQQVLAATEQAAAARPAPETGGDAATAAGGSDEAAEDVKTCEPSQSVAMQIALIDLIVNRNDWAPATPMYKIGFFWIVDWERTPWFDNKAAFQMGVLDVLRAFALELRDTMGRVRGTSAANQDLVGAQSRLQINERAWVLNSPFDRDNALIATTTAAGSYRGAISSYERFNAELASCDALFDARADNLRVVLDRMTKALGSTTDQLAKRSRGEVYDPSVHAFVEGPGNNRGWFDFRADNLFHRARGQMYALHGLLQGVRADFETVIERRDLADVWDRMEAHVAEAAVLHPLIVSNGRADGMFAPSHLSAMAESIFRARANMVELREIIDR